MADLKVTQVRSSIGTKPKHRGTLRALGLGRIRQSVVREDSPALQGMLRRVASLVRGDGARPASDPDGLAAADGNLPAQARFVEGLVAYAQGDSQASAKAQADLASLQRELARLP